MSKEDLITYDLGPQNDGEPAVVEAVAHVVEEKPVVEPEAKTGEETPAKEVPEEALPRIPGSRRDRERRIAAEAKLELLLAQQAGKAAPEAPKQGKPTSDQFDTHDAYIEALTDWKVEEKLKSKSAESEKAKSLTGWEAKKDAAREKYEDFDEALESANASPVVLQVMLESDAGAEIAYYLATHPKELREINAMGTRAATHALDALEENLVKPKTAPVKAPKPPSPVVATSVTRSNDGRLEVY